MFAGNNAQHFSDISDTDFCYSSPPTQRVSNTSSKGRRVSVGYDLRAENFLEARTLTALSELNPEAQACEWWARWPFACSKLMGRCSSNTHLQVHFHTRCFWDVWARWLRLDWLLCTFLIQFSYEWGLLIFKGAYKEKKTYKHFINPFAASQLSLLWKAFVQKEQGRPMRPRLSYNRLHVYPSVIAEQPLRNVTFPFRSTWFLAKFLGEARDPQGTGLCRAMNPSRRAKLDAMSETRASTDNDDKR